MISQRRTLLLLLWLVGPALHAQQPRNSEVAVIHVVDQQTGRGVPLVELETIAHNRFVTDSHGRVSITAPDLLDRNVFFTIRSHGYQFEKDGFGFRGQALNLKRGSTSQLSIERKNIAERLYRSTGSGIFVDTEIAGLKSKGQPPLLSADVVGCDSVMTATYDGKLYWFWGDTNRPHYPIGGNFHMTGATTALPTEPQARFEFLNQPPSFQYFTDDKGAIRGVATLAGDGPTWLSAVTVLPSAPTGSRSEETMVAGFIKVRNQLEAYRWGFAIWNDQHQRFEELKSFDARPKMFCDPQTHTFLHREGEVDYVYFANPLPLTRVPATPEAFIDPEQYEGYSCLKANTTIQDHQVDRDEDGQLIYAWKKSTPALTPQLQQQFESSGLIKESEALVQLRDTDTGRRLVAHRGSVYWNKFRNRWLMIAVEIGGQSSHLGEVWYAEADQPTGPWALARKVVTHDKYSFYNPKHHPEFDSPDGSVIYFEGTYTTTFSGNAYPTERYDYNQVMYRLDLKHAAMKLPVVLHTRSSSP